MEIIQKWISLFVRFVNMNSILLVLCISVLFVGLFALMIVKLKRLCLFEFLLFAVSFFIVGVHFVADLIGYIIYWDGRPDLTWILFATIFYLLALIIDFIVLMARITKKPEKAQVSEPQEAKAEQAPVQAEPVVTTKASEEDQLKDRGDLEVAISSKIDHNKEFGLTFIQINNNQNLVDDLGKATATKLVEEYLKGALKDLFGKKDELYKISSGEYCILTSDLDAYQDNLHMVKNQNSELLDSTVENEGEKHPVTNVLGFVHSNSVPEKNSLEYVEAGRLALYLATNKECRYVEYNLDDLKDNALEFEKCKVDLSNKFLENL